jgi:hypothetical protein
LPARRAARAVSITAARGAGAEVNAEQRLAGPVDDQHVAGRVEHQHRIGQAVDRRLRRLLGEQQLAQRAAPVAVEPVGHGVERGGELPDLVRADLVDPRREVAAADAVRGCAQRDDGTDEPLRQQRPRGQPEQHRENGDGNHHRLNRRGLLVGGGALAQHGVLIQLQHPLGGAAHGHEAR